LDRKTLEAIRLMAVERVREGESDGCIGGVEARYRSGLAAPAVMFRLRGVDLAGSHPRSVSSTPSSNWACGFPASSSRTGITLYWQQFCLRPAQTFGDLANFNPHVHVLAADGAFLPDGTFFPLPPVPGRFLVEGFRRAVPAFLVRQQGLSEVLCGRMLG